MPRFLTIEGTNFIYVKNTVFLFLFFLPMAHYKYVYDGQGNIVRSIDILGKKEYNYSYEDGRLVRATESDITLSSVLLGNVEFQNKRIVKLILDSCVDSTI